MEDIRNVRGVLQTTLEGSRGLSPKLAGLIRRFKAVTTLLLMKRDSAYSDLDKYTKCLRNWVEEFDKRMRSSIQLAYEEKAAIVKAYREELEEEMSTLGVLLKESEKLLQMSTVFDATQNEHGKTLITALKMMKTTSRLETRDVDENLSCLKLSTEYDCDQLPKLGQLMTSYSSDEATAQEVTSSPQNQSSDKSKCQVTMQSEYTQTENEPQEKIKRSNSGQRSKEKRSSNNQSNQRFVLSQLEKGGISRQGSRVTEPQSDSEMANLDNGSQRGEKTRRPIIRDTLFKPGSPSAKRKVDKKGDHLKDTTDEDLTITTQKVLKLSNGRVGPAQPSNSLGNKNMKDFSWENEVVNVSAKETENQPPPHLMPVSTIPKTSDVCPHIQNSLTPISKTSDVSPCCPSLLTTASKASDKDFPNPNSVNTASETSETGSSKASSVALTSNMPEIIPPNTSTAALASNEPDGVCQNSSSIMTSDINVVDEMSTGSLLKTSSEKRVDVNANVCAEKQSSSSTNQKGDNEPNKTASEVPLSKPNESRQSTVTSDAQTINGTSKTQVAVPKEEPIEPVSMELKKIPGTGLTSKTKPKEIAIKSEPLSPVEVRIKEEPQTPTDLNNNNNNNIDADQQNDKKFPVSAKDTWKAEPNNNEIPQTGGGLVTEMEGQQGEVEQNTNKKQGTETSPRKENGLVVTSETDSQQKTQAVSNELDCSVSDIPLSQTDNKSLEKENVYVTSSEVESQPKSPVSNQINCSLSDIPLPKSPYPGPATKTQKCLPSTSVVTKHIRDEINRGNTYRYISPLHAKLLFKVGKKDQVKFPIGVTTNSLEEILVADTGNHVVQLFDPEGKFLRDIGREVSMKRPSAIVVNYKDDVFVKDDMAVYAFSAQGKLMRTIAKGKLGHPFGLALTPDGLLVTLDTTRNNPRVVILSQDGSLMNCFPFAHLLNPRVPVHLTSKCRFLAVQAERLIVSDLGNSCVYISDNRGEILFEFGDYGTSHGKFKEPSGVTTDQQGHMLIGDSKNNRVQIFKPNGSFLCDIQFDTAIQRPSDIHLTRDGKLYVSNYLQHQVFVYQLGEQ